MTDVVVDPELREHDLLHSAQGPQLRRETPRAGAAQQQPAELLQLPPRQPRPTPALRLGVQPSRSGTTKSLIPPRYRGGHAAHLQCNVPRCQALLRQGHGQPTPGFQVVLAPMGSHSPFRSHPGSWVKFRSVPRGEGQYAPCPVRAALRAGG